jgi:hypothetical protein
VFHNTGGEEGDLRPLSWSGDCSATEQGLSLLQPGWFGRTSEAIEVDDGKNWLVIKGLIRVD